MLLYKYKNKYYFSWEDLLKDLPKINFLSSNIDRVPEGLFEQLGITTKTIDDPLPEVVIEEQRKKVRIVRNKYLNETDKYMLRDYPIEQLDLDNIVSYRQYLRDYTNSNDWWKARPKSLEEWNSYDFDLYERL